MKVRIFDSKYLILKRWYVQLLIDYVEELILYFRCCLEDDEFLLDVGPMEFGDLLALQDVITVDIAHDVYISICCEIL
ncbi:hypothetical protein L2E82_51688 [Cichorium intybus]|nr:hypothetical protein L2E82_51688 [Cichorium intybus]